MGLKVGAVTLPDNAAGVSIGGTAVGGIVIDGDVVWRAPALTAPPVPAGLAVAATSATSLTASWSAAARATTYQIRYRSGTGAWTTPAADASLSRVITGLTAATQYRVQVRAINAAGMSSWSSTVRQTTAAAPLALPGVPTSVAAAATLTTLTLTWTAPASGGAVASYDVRIGATVSTGETSPHAFTGLTPDTAYRVSVRAVNATGSSAWVDVSSRTQTPALAVPPVPADLVVATSGSTLRARWSAAARATSYQLDYRVSGASDWISLSGAARSRTITGLTAATTYQFRVRASNATGNSAWSSIVTGTTAAAPTLEVPGPVRNLAGTPAMASIALTWDGPSTGGAVAGYDVRYDDDGGSGTLIELGANARGHSITGLTAGTAYRVRVWAKNATGLSTVSTVSVTTTGTAPVAVPPVPADLVVATSGTTSERWSSDWISLTAPRPTNSPTASADHRTEMCFRDFHRTDRRLPTSSGSGHRTLQVILRGRR